MAVVSRVSVTQILASLSVTKQETVRRILISSSDKLIWT